MSGGFFDYQQYRLQEMARELQLVMEDGKDENPWYNFSERTLAEFKTALELLGRTEVYLQRIDWLLSADDGEDTFHIHFINASKKIWGIWRNQDLEKLNENEN